MNARSSILVPILLAAACTDDGPRVAMPAGFESAALGRSFKDVRAERPKARLVRQDGSVYLQETDKPPRFSHARIWFHDGSRGAPPSDDTLRVVGAEFTTAEEDAIQQAASHVATVEAEEAAELRRVQGTRFEAIRKWAMDAYGKPTSCDEERLACTWSFSSYEARLFTIDARDASGRLVPVAVRYAVRAPGAPELQPPPPIEAVPARPPEAKIPQDALRFEPPPEPAPDGQPAAPPAAPAAPRPHAPHHGHDHDHHGHDHDH